MSQTSTDTTNESNDSTATKRTAVTSAATHLDRLAWLEIWLDMVVAKRHEETAKPERAKATRGWAASVRWVTKREKERQATERNRVPQSEELSGA